MFSHENENISTWVAKNTRRTSFFCRSGGWATLDAPLALFMTVRAAPASAFPAGIMCGNILSRRENGNGAAGSACCALKEAQQKKDPRTATQISWRACVQPRVSVPVPCEVSAFSSNSRSRNKNAHLKQKNNPRIQLSINSGTEKFWFLRKLQNP